MANLIQCKDCGNQISRNAESCPNCGAKNKKTSIITWLALIFIGIPVLWSVFSGAANDTPSEPVAEVEEVSPSETLETFDLDQDNFDKHAWAAASYSQMLIKQSMKDPDSAEFGSIRYVKASKEFPATICSQVNGKNSFNGYSGFKDYYLIPELGIYNIDDGNPEFKKAYSDFCILK